MKRIVVKDSKGKKKLVNIPTNDNICGMDLGIGSAGSNIINNPVIFNPITGLYYTLSIHGVFGNEYLQLDYTNLTNTTSVVLFDLSSGGYYTISIVGNFGNETLEIDTINSTNITPLQIYNSDTNRYYNVSIVGNFGNESLQLDPI